MASSSAVYKLRTASTVTTFPCQAYTHTYITHMFYFKSSTQLYCITSRISSMLAHILADLLGSYTEHIHGQGLRTQKNILQSIYIRYKIPSQKQGELASGRPPSIHRPVICSLLGTTTFISPVAIRAYMTKDQAKYHHSRKTLSPFNHFSDPTSFGSTIHGLGIYYGIHDIWADGSASLQSPIAPSSGWVHMLVLLIRKVQW